MTLLRDVRRGALVLSVATIAAALAFVASPVVADEGSAHPNTKRCVGDPPRQTEDPESLPCIPYFHGDNGGATAPGVTADEVRVAIRIEGGINYLPTSGEAEQVPANRLYDLSTPPSGDEPSQVRGARQYQAWFNSRYQTYGRFLHLFVYTSNANEADVSARSDAADIVETTDPFAVIDASSHEGQAEFAEAIAQAGRIAVSDSPALSAALAREHPGRIWSAQPSDEQAAALFTSYGCNLDLSQGAVALVRTTDQRFPGLVRQGELVRAGLQACGVTISDEYAFPEHGYAFNSESSISTGAAATARSFQVRGVETVFLAGGYSADLPRAAAAIGYSPHWIVAGDGMSEGNAGGRYAAGWIRSTAVAANLDAPPWSTKACQLGLTETTSTPMSPGARVRSCGLYDSLRLAANGIQAAGPQLTKSSFDSGLHAIPQHAAAAPQSPACYFEEGDYSCRKDVAVAHWSPVGFNPDAAPGAINAPGCWRLVAGGRRYRAGDWSSIAPAGPSDPCSDFTSAVYIRF